MTNVVQIHSLSESIGGAVELRDLEAFLAGARVEHFGRAAEARHMSQSALSKAIARIEDELGVPLFDRIGRAVRLNRYGELFRTHVDEAFRALETGRAAVADAVDPDRGMVALAFIPSLGPTLIPRLVHQFGRDHPRIRFLLSQGGAASVIDMLRNGQVDLCVVSPDPDLREVHWEPLWTERLVLAGTPGDPAVDRKGPVRLCDVGDRAFVALKPGYGLRQITDALCAEAGVAPRIVFEGADVPTVRGLVGAGLGLAILPRAAESDSRLGIHEVELADVAARRTVGIAAARDRYMPVAARALREFVIRNWPELSPPPTPGVR